MPVLFPFLDKVSDLNLGPGLLMYGWCSASPGHVPENATATALAEDEMKIVESILSTHPVAGEWYHPHGMQPIDM